MDLTINKLTLENAKDINLLSAQLGYSLSLEQTINQIQIIIEQKDHLALVAITENKIIGWIHAFIAFRIESKPIIEIGGLVVNEVYRNKNAGRKLVEKVAEWCRNEKINTLRVRCNTKRKESHLFYQKLNFTEIKEQKIFQLNV